MTALKVAGPKKVVSYPVEPARGEPVESRPVAETVKPWEFKNCWSNLTSVPREPHERFRVNGMKEERAGGGTVKAVVVAPVGLVCTVKRGEDGEMAVKPADGG